VSGWRIPGHPRAAAQALRFRFDGREFQGREGDTLAAALLANGVRLVGRSFKYHRPRGVIGAGFSETNALVSIDGTPNLPATRVPLTEGLDARSINRWPSLAFDLGALNGLAGKLLSAGFYYKTFIWPRWELFEPFIRRAAGLGHAPVDRDADRYDSRSAACDVLVIGAGPAGVAAARVAAQAGADVLLLEAGDLAAPPAGLRALARTTAMGYYDHNLVTALEEIDAPGLRQRLWKIRAKRVVLACGAFERPLLFDGNDRPGVMLAGAVRHYVEEHGVAPGERAVFAVSDDSGLAAAEAARAGGIDVADVIDLRTTAESIRVIGRGGVRGVTIGGRRVACDLVAMSGGWSPAVQLATQAGAGLRFEPAIGAFVPGAAIQDERSCGAARGVFGEAACVADGEAAGRWAATGADMPPARYPETGSATPVLPAPGAKAFVDFQTDVTTDDLRQATLENYRSVEHVKRYTVWGMGVDQGRLSAVNGVVALAALQGVEPGALGTTKFRPPFAPLAFGALAAGHGLGMLFHPWKQLPAHDWHLRHGAEFEEHGWLRPTHYPRPGETIDAAARREALAVRHGVGLLDSSSFGKIEIKGPEAARFLDLMSVASPSTIPVGKVRYNLLTDELGALLDDGVVARLAEDHFLMTASSGHAERVRHWLDQWLQCEWPLDCAIADVTAQWAVLTLAGPRARAVLERAECDIDCDPIAFPHNAIREGTLAGAPVRVQRVSFTGEPSYEIAVSADRAEALADWLMTCGAAAGIVPFGLEALDLLRLEKGYIYVGGDTDSRTQPADIGWGKGVARKVSDFVGKRSLLHASARDPRRAQLVGLQSIEPGDLLPIGAHVIGGSPHPSQGVVTSSGFSPMLERGLSLALLDGGHARMDEVVTVWSDGRTWAARVSPVCPFDPAGERLNG
jgi:sarcosine oxidase subunit alpha